MKGDDGDLRWITKLLAKAANGSWVWLCGESAGAGGGGGSGGL